MKFTDIRGLAAAAAVALTGATTAHADTPYYEGQTIKVVVGFSPGGGTDFFGRLMAENIGRYIDGNPTVIVENMPGAGSVLASNYYVDRAPRDGSELLIGTGQLLMRIVLGLEGSTANLGDLEPVVALPMGRMAYGSTAAGINSAADLLNPSEPLFLGVPEVISTIETVLGLTLLSVDYTAIPGYGGKSDTFLAFERGELNLDAQTTPVFLNQPLQAIEAGRAVPLFAQGILDAEGNLVRDPAYPDIPTVAEVHLELHGEEPSGPAWEAYRAAVTAIGNGGKILMMHSDTPDEAREAIFTAVDRLLADDEFIASAAEAAEGYEFTVGSELAAAVNAVANMSESDIEWFRDFLREGFEMEFN